MLGDTIVALASAAGAAARAVLRLSGPASRAAAAVVFAPAMPAGRAQVDGVVRLRGAELPALALCMVAPASFTGEDTVELHVPGSPLLVRLLLDRILQVAGPLGVREALPGEFTARACRNGRLDLAQAEGILLLLAAADQRDAAAALQWLRGGLSATVGEVRTRLQDVLALLEAGLDFTEDETGAVPAAAWMPSLERIEADLRAVLASLPAAAPGGEVLLLGRANAGKSSLCNALAGRAAMLVDGTPGTTRDLVRIEVAPGVAVWDAPGDLDDPSAADAAALALRDRLAGRAAAALAVLDATAPDVPASLLRTELPLLAVVFAKCDLVGGPPSMPAALRERFGAGLPVLATSAATGAGLEPLRELLGRAAATGGMAAGAPLREALQLALAAVARARDVAAAGAELVAAEVQAGLRALDGIDGRHSPEQLLDRIYGRFCLGK